MKSTGMVRKTDELGRVCLPIELRRTLGIEDQESLEIFIDEESIILKKYQPGCVFCGEMENVVHHWNKLVCKKCIEESSEKLKSK